MLRHAAASKQVKRASADVSLAWLAQQHALDMATAQTLQKAYRDLHHLFHMLRLTCHGKFNENEALSGLKKLLAQSMGLKSFDEVRSKLVAIEDVVKETYIRLLNPSMEAS